MRILSVLALSCALAAPVAWAAPPIPARAATPCYYYAPGTTVSPERSQQVMVADRTSGTKGTWARWEWRGRDRGCWVKVNGAAGSRFGKNGVIAAAQRRQGDMRTPAGAFSIPFTFGERNPGTRMPYRLITQRAVWVNNPKLADYNRWRAKGSYSGRGIGEDLSAYRDSGQYRQAAVIAYNYTRPVRYGRGSGAGIFLHYARYYTGGCVGLTSQAELSRTIAWLDPARKPVIVIKA